MPHSGLHFLRFWCDWVPKSSILGVPWRPAGSKLAPQIGQVVIKNVLILFLGNTPEPACFKVAFRDAPGHRVDRFLMILGQMLMDFGIICDGFWLLLCSSFCRMPKPPGTKRNNGKRQEHADNCRNMQTSSAKKEKHQNFDR